MTWERLDHTYGSMEVIEDALFKRIDTFPKIANRDYPKLTKLSDLLLELQSAKDEGDLLGLAFLDTARGANPIVQKLPFRLQEKWASVGAAYKRQNHVPYPPFAYFVNFVSQEARIGNDPSFSFVSHIDSAHRFEKTDWKSSKQREVSVHKTEAFSRVPIGTEELSKESDDCEKLCPIHRKPHPLRKCRAFRERPIEARKSILKENNVCFKCCSSQSHIAKYCKDKVQCSECDSEKHHTALHPGPAPWLGQVNDASEHGGEREERPPRFQVNSTCTGVCGEDQTDRSCSKICLVKVFPAGHRNKAVKLYAILDEQSNRSLVRSQFFEVFSDQSPSAPYTLRTCAGVKETVGRRASGYEIESLDGTVRIPLPSLIECNDIPNNRDEIPTPDVARSHPHLKSVAHLIPEQDPQAPIMLLLGRDIIRVHKVRKQVNGSHNLPYAQKLDLGWLVVGNVCLGNVHKPLTIKTFHTNIIESKRPTLFQPCPNVFHVKEKYGDIQLTKDSPTDSLNESVCDVDHLGCTVFKQTKEDNQVAPSIQDTSFMQIMDKGLQRDSNHSWVAPLPFKSPRQCLPNNRPQALKRLMSLNWARSEQHTTGSTDPLQERSHCFLSGHRTDLDLEADALPMQRSLGLNWNLHTDCFLFSVCDAIKPFTRRGVLSTINSLYDLLGFVAPVTIQGKSILRQLTIENGDWDARLPQEMEEAWTTWRDNLAELSNLSISRPYTETSPSAAVRRELCVFSDASTKAIAAVAYLKVTDAAGNNHIGFVMGKAKLTPRPEHTVPRLELCAAVLAVELSDLIAAELDLQLDAITYYSDSKVVLGYISNETRRFYVYVSNRVQRIRRASYPGQWRYVPTDQNPADHATRSFPAARLQSTNWLSGPKFLLMPEADTSKSPHDLVAPSSDPDVRPLVSSLSKIGRASCRERV